MSNFVFKRGKLYKVKEHPSGDGGIFGWAWSEETKSFSIYHWMKPGEVVFLSKRGTKNMVRVLKGDIKLQMNREFLELIK